MAKKDSEKTEVESGAVEVTDRDDLARDRATIEVQRDPEVERRVQEDLAEAR